MKPTTNDDTVTKYMNMIGDKRSGITRTCFKSTKLPDRTRSLQASVIILLKPTSYSHHCIKQLRVHNSYSSAPFKQI